MSLTSRVPDKPSLEGLEEKWAAVWKEQQTYAFDRTAERADVYSIDTPPPTVSGSLHVGHIFSYTHTDLVARFQRMRGKKVFYPIGWDDNGLPTERRVQNYYGVRCDPSLPYDPDFTPPAKPDPKRQLPISRQNFVDLCGELTHIDEQAFEAMWRTGRPERRLVVPLHHDLRGLPPYVAAGVPAQLRPRRGVPVRGADDVGRHVPDRGRAGRAGGAELSRRLPPDRVPRRRTGRSISRRPGPS